MEFNSTQITSIIATVAGIISLYLKMRAENKKANKDLTNLILQRISGLEDNVNSFKVDWVKFKNDAMFRMKFRNGIAERASTILISSRGTKTLHEFNSVLLDWVHYIQDFGLKYWYSSYRLCLAKENYNEHDLREYIELDMTTYINHFETKLKNEIKGEKVYKVGSKNIAVNFADFLKTTKCYVLSELLLIDLVKNGFQEDGNSYRIRFEKFTNDFIGQFIDAVISWRDLDNYDEFLEKQIDKI